VNGNVRAEVVDGSAALDAVVAVGMVAAWLDPVELELELELELPEEAAELDGTLEPEEPDVDVGVEVKLGVDDVAGCWVWDFPLAPESGSTYC